MSELKEIDREKLADLLAKVRAATGDDIGLFYEISVALVGKVPVSVVNLVNANGFTDAALVLVEKMLPGTMWRVQSDPDTGDGFEATLIPDDIHPAADAKQDGATAPLAILAALLSALSSIKEVGK